MTESDRVFVSIGVSRPGGDLDELPGAIKAAERMAAWAAAQGYATVLVHDRKHGEVTVDLLRDQMAAAITEVTDRTELKRLVVFFAGHGAAMAVGDQYWILTHWKKRPTEAIKVSSLQRMLEYYGPRQVAIIGDACQEFSAKFIDVVGSPVLDMPDEDQAPYELDQFFAVDAGKQAFMIKGVDGQDDFCLFTEVLLDALEGDAAQASYEQIGQDLAVTSQSLAVYLDGHVAQEAGKYGVRMVPRPKPGFYTDRIYLKMPPQAVGQLPMPAPTQAGATPQTAAAPSAGVEPPTTAAPPAPATSPPPAMAPAPSTPPAPAGPSGAAPASGRPPLPSSAGNGSARAGQSPQPARSLRAVEKVRLRLPERLVALAEQAQAILQTREARRDAFAEQVGRATVRDHFETGCGICVSGADVVEVQASHGEVSPVEGEPNWFRIHLGDSSDSLLWSDTVVTLASGRLCSVCVVQEFVAAMHVLDETSISLFHRRIGADESQGRIAIDLMARANAGLLSQDEIIDAAMSLRDGKHRVITLGCIVAQFYDTIRDIDSLRSMASFYAQCGQPVPLDIVLYGGGRVFESGGRLYADIPAVPARTPRTRGEQRQGFCFDATPGFDRHPLAGRVPWMRHAWGAVTTASCDKSAEPWRKQALAAMAHLAPGAFTGFLPAGRQALEELVGLETSALASQYVVVN
ncbi:MULTISPECIES: hypothetical protein [unclassified Luteimonas]